MACNGIARGRGLHFLAAAFDGQLRVVQLFLKLQISAQRIVGTRTRIGLCRADRRQIANRGPQIREGKREQNAENAKPFQIQARVTHAAQIEPLGAPCQETRRRIC
jgi:hypothetical protein